MHDIHPQTAEALPALLKGLSAMELPSVCFQFPSPGMSDGGRCTFSSLGIHVEKTVRDHPTPTRAGLIPLLLFSEKYEGFVLLAARR